MAYTDKEMIDQLNKLKYGWICLDTWIEKSSNKFSRMAKLQHSISKEIIICQYGDAKKNLVRFPKFYNQQLNIKAKEGLNKLKLGWSCLDTWTEKSSNKFSRMAKLQHSISKEIIICQYKDAKKNQVRFPKFDNIKAKDVLNKLKYDWICLDTFIEKQRRMAKLKHSISKEIITCLYQEAKKNKVRFPKYEKMKYIEELNKLKRGWICLDTFIEKQRRMAKLQHSISKEIIVCDYQEAKKNNVRFPKFEDIKRFKKINELGLKANPQYECISSNCGYRRSHVLVSIKRKDGIGTIKKVWFGSLRQGSNPFNETQNRVEVEKIQPMYEKLLKRLKIDYVKEYKLGKKRIDFMLTINSKRYGLEVKQSEKKHYSGQNQIGTYRKLANLKQYKLEKVFLSDPKGNHSHKGSLSINELEKSLNNLLLSK